MPVEHSTNRVLHIRGQVRTVGEISPATVDRIVSGGIDGPATYGKTGLATIAGMPGEAAPDHDGALARLDGKSAADELPHAQSEQTEGEQK